MNTEGLVALAVFVGFGVLGVRSTYRLWRIVWFDGETRRQRILLALALISTAITVAALWFGFQLVRKALGFDPLPVEFTVPVGIIVVSSVLLIPTAIERLVAQISSGDGTERGRDGHTTKRS